MRQEKALNIFSALSQDSRLEIFRLLTEHRAKGLCAGDIGKKLNIAKNTLSFHLLLLTNAGLLKKRKEGTFIFYSVNADAVDDLMDFLVKDCYCKNCTCDECNCKSRIHRKTPKKIKK